jgi:hypothetical protein
MANPRFALDHFCGSGGGKRRGEVEGGRGGGERRGEEEGGSGGRRRFKSLWPDGSEDVPPLPWYSLKGKPLERRYNLPLTEIQVPTRSRSYILYRTKILTA